MAWLFSHSSFQNPGVKSTSAVMISRRPTHMSTIITTCMAGENAVSPCGPYPPNPAPPLETVAIDRPIPSTVPHPSTMRAADPTRIVSMYVMNTTRAD